MNFAEKAFWATCQRLVLIQLLFVFSTMVVFLLFFSKPDGFSLALLYGGMVSISVTLYRAWRLKIATSDVDSAYSTDAVSDELNKLNSVNALELYKGFFIGYIIVIALLVMGLSGLKLEPVAVIIGFVIAQFAHFFVRVPKPGYGR